MVSGSVMVIVSFFEGSVVSGRVVVMRSVFEDDVVWQILSVSSATWSKNA